MEFDYSFTKQDIQNYKSEHLIHIRLLFAIFYSLAAVLFVVLIFVPDAVFEYLVYLFAFSLVYAILLNVFYVVGFKRISKVLLTEYTKIYYSFTETDFTEKDYKSDSLDAPVQSVTISYEKFVKVRETKSLLFLYLNPWVAIMVPKNAFSAEQLQTATMILRSKIAKYKIKK